MRPLRIAFTILAVLISVSYPLVVYFGLKNWSPKYIAALLGIALIIRQIISAKRNTLLGISGWVLIGFTLLGFIKDDRTLLQYYPVLVNSMMLCIFGFTLLKPPSLIEQLARLTEPDLPESGVQYTRNVTAIWCLFFLINGLTALYTVLCSSIEIWTLYNGLISYILMGVLFLGEWLVRRRVRNG